MMLRRWVLGLLSAGVLASACSGGDDDEGAGRGGQSNSGTGGNATGGRSSGGSDATGGTFATGGAATGGTEASTGGVNAQGGESASGGEGNDPCADCPSGACLSPGECVDCTANSHCSAPTAFCDTDANVCVACLPSDDQCPEHEYCTAEFSCIPGCKNDESCASGSCSDTHDCNNCVLDAECAEERVCSTGTCSAACNSDDDCGSANCCSSHCVDFSGNVDHCGSCGNACSASEFCGMNGCVEDVLANLCDHAKAAGLLDGLPTDEAGTRSMLATLAGCSPAPTTREVSQTVRDVINPETGHVIAQGGELVVAAGGDFAQKLVDYAETNRTAPVYDVLEGTDQQLRLSGSDDLILSVPLASLTATRDVFVVELIRDPNTGSVALVAFGLGSAGTDAAVWYFKNVMFGDRENLTSSWYVYEWTDSDATAGPSAGDTFARRGE